MTSSAWRDSLAIIRYHIVLIAMTATLTFGFLMSGRYYFWLALLSGFDWFLINLLNRVTDIEEDLKNNIQGTERVARKKGLLAKLSFALLIGSFATHFVAPQLTLVRLAVHWIGLAYNYRLVPTFKGMRRFKELYFFKNFGSACIFVLTGFGYPFMMGESSMSPSSLMFLVIFFVFFEITYEILYDFRDLEGDRNEGIPTYPVVHGEEISRRIIHVLLVLSALVLLGGFFVRQLGVRELLMIAAPTLQFLFYRPRLARGLTSHDCIVLTHLGTAQLVLYLIGTRVWLELGLPENVLL